MANRIADIVVPLTRNERELVIEALRERVADVRFDRREAFKDLQYRFEVARESPDA